MMRMFLSIKYFADHRNKPLVEDICALLAAKGFETISIDRDIEKWGERTLSPQELMSETFAALNSCDLVLVELSVKGVGLGIEAGYAFAKNKPVVTIAHAPADISESLAGISTATFTYVNLDDLGRFFDEFGSISQRFAKT